MFVGNGGYGRCRRERLVLKHWKRIDERTEGVKPWGVIVVFGVGRLTFGLNLFLRQLPDSNP